MVVAVQKGHENIKQQLRVRGYDVVTIGEYHQAIDAMIYFGSITEDAQMKAGMDMTFSNGISNGVLMINAQNKSISEIDMILKQKVYSPLF